MFSSYHDDLLRLLKKELKSKRGWKIGREDRKIFYPFSIGNVKRYTHLLSHFAAGNEITVVKKHGNTVKNVFNIYTGLHYNHDEYENDKCLYYDIQRDDFYIRKYGILYPQKFYRNLQNKVKDLDCELHYPDDKGEYEEIYLYCEELDIEKLHSYYERFKLDIVIPYIRNL